MRSIVRDPVVVLSPILLFGCLLACAPSPPDADALIASAKDVVTNHESEAMAGNLDGIVANAAEDIVVLAAGAPLVLGRDALREFYEPLLQAASVEFRHEYSGAEVIGDAVVLYGVSRGTMTPRDGMPAPMVNNFLMILKPDASGVMKLWRVAFAPPSM